MRLLSADVGLIGYEKQRKPPDRRWLNVSSIAVRLKLLNNCRVDVTVIVENASPILCVFL